MSIDFSPVVGSYCTKHIGKTLYTYIYIYIPTLYVMYYMCCIEHSAT